MATEKNYPPFFAEVTAAAEMFVANHRGMNINAMPQWARFVLMRIEARFNAELGEYFIPKDEVSSRNRLGGTE